MLAWPDWNKLYAEGNCLYYGVAFSDEQWAKLEKAENPADREKLVREFREEFMKNRDLATGELKKETPVIPEKPNPDDEHIVAVEWLENEVEESIEDVKPTKKKGK